jgi:hypothetical protein
MLQVFTMYVHLVFSTWRMQGVARIQNVRDICMLAFLEEIVADMIVDFEALEQGTRQDPRSKDTG